MGEKKQKEKEERMAKAATDASLAAAAPMLTPVNDQAQQAPAGPVEQVAPAEDNNKEIIELQDLRMSPIPSIRNRFGGAQGGRTRSDVADNFPPSFRINRGYSTASGGRSSASGTSGSAMEKARQSRLLSQLKKGTSTLKAALPRIKDVNIIDKYSRVIFPVSFLVFNIAYWCFYVLEKNEE